MMKTLGTVLAGGLIAAAIAALMPPPNLFAAASCESLSSLRLSDTTITLARLVPAGEFSRPAAAVAVRDGQRTVTFRCPACAGIWDRTAPDLPAFWHVSH